jgi:hypothetical protein
VTRLVSVLGSAHLTDSAGKHLALITYSIQGRVRGVNFSESGLRMNEVLAGQSLAAGASVFAFVEGERNAKVFLGGSGPWLYLGNHGVISRYRTRSSAAFTSARARPAFSPFSGGGRRRHRRVLVWRILPR